MCWDVVWCGVVWCGVVWCGVVGCDAMRCDAMRCDAMRCDAMRYYGMGCSRMGPMGQDAWHYWTARRGNLVSFVGAGNNLLAGRRHVNEE